jgi:hypothetical protein
MIDKSRMMKVATLSILLVLTTCRFAHADDPFLDELARYALRIDGMTVMSGNAKEANAAMQIIDPWPRNAQNRNIPVNAQRLIGGIDRYQTPSKLGTKAPTLSPELGPGATSGGSGGAAGQ